MKISPKTMFGAIAAPKPKWATWLFRSVAILTTVASFWVNSTSLMINEVKVEAILALKTIDMLVLGFSNLFGVIIPDKQKNQTNA